jgi:drug/metabolite transporter (DMT)-like permease
MGVFFIFLACLTWALDTLIRYPLLGEGFNAVTIVFFEHLFLSLLFIPTFYKLIKNKRLFNLSNFSSFLVIGSLGSAIATLSFTKAFSLLNPSIVILLQKFQPAVAITLSSFFLKEKISRGFLFWAGVCVIGGFVISYQQIFSSVDLKALQYTFSSRESLLGVGYSLVAVLGWGSATVFGKKLSKQGFSVPEVMSGRFIFGLSACLVFLPSVSLVKVESDFLTKMVVLVFLSGVFGIYFYYRGLAKIPAKMATLAELFFPLCAVVINWLFLHTTLDWVQILGGITLVLGSTVIQLKKY